MEAKSPSSTISFLLLTSLAGPLATVPAQTIITAEGSVQLKGGNSGASSIGAGYRLKPNESVIPGQGADVKILCDDSTVWRVPVGVESGLSDGCSSAGAVRGKLGLRPGGSNPRLPFVLSPRMTNILEDRPTFQWNPVTDARWYIVRVCRPGEELWQKKVTGTMLDYPQDAPELKVRLQYLLTVETDAGASSLTDSGGNLGFEILPSRKIRKVREGEGELEVMTDLTHEEKALAFAQLYKSMGLIEEAIERLKAIVDQGSRHALISKELADLYAISGLNLLAEAHYSQARVFASDTQNQFLINEIDEALTALDAFPGSETTVEDKPGGCQVDQILTLR